ncbi:MAG: GNAT family N-acetyltransferase [Minicystis sp.]
MTPATIEDLERFVRDHPVVDTDAALLRLFLVSTPRSPEHVLDLGAGGERVLVASVLDTMGSASAGALLLLLGFREREGSAEALGRALEAAEELVRRGPRRRLEVPLPAALQRHAPVLSARGYAIAFAYYHMARPAEAPPPAPLPDGLRWVSATTADAEAMQALSAAAFAGVPGWYGAGVDAMRAMIAEAPIPPRLVRAGDRLVACARVGLDPGGEDGLIHSIARDPAFRGRGLGVPLLAEAMRTLHAAGARRFKLDVAAVNQRAIALYLRHGFVVTSEEPTYHKSLEVPSR